MHRVEILFSGSLSVTSNFSLSSDISYWFMGFEGVLAIALESGCIFILYSIG